MCGCPYLFVGVLTKFYNSIGKVWVETDKHYLSNHQSYTSFVFITICFGVNLVKQKEIFDMNAQLPLGRRQQWSLETRR
jgi:hypothetical protein